MGRSDRLAQLYEQLESVNDAISKVLAGQSYSLGSRSVTRANLSELRAMREDIADEIEALEASGTTRRRFVRVSPGW